MPLAAAERASEAASQVELDQLRARIKEMDQALARERGAETALEGEVRQAEQLITARAADARRTAGALREQDARAAEAAVARDTAGKAVESGRRDLAATLRAAYQTSAPGPLQMLFRLDEAGTLARLEADAAAVARAIDRRVASFRAQLDHLAAADAALAAERAALDLRQVESTAALAQLSQAQDQRRQVLDVVRRDNAGRAADLKQAQGEARRLQQLIERLRRALEAQPRTAPRGVPLPKLRGRLPWPLRGELLASFGQPKAGGVLNWSGWWISAAEGAPVRAVADGRVAYVGWVQRFGLMVIVDHAGKYLSLYGHLRDSSVEVGETIKGGAAMAAAGSSGGHDRSGLYFEIRKGTTPVDPAGWLAP